MEKTSWYWDSSGAPCFRITAGILSEPKELMYQVWTNFEGVLRSEYDFGYTI